MELCERASGEQDPEKLLQLTQEIICLLDGKEKRIKAGASLSIWPPNRHNVPAISLPFALHYTENKRIHAICCVVSCWNYVRAGIRFLPCSPCIARESDQKPGSGLHRQHNTEDRAASKLAGDGYLAAVSLDDCLYDRQSHSGALHAVALILAAIELVEDQALLHIVNADTSVGHA